jgi:hypothetical protein
VRLLERAKSLLVIIALIVVACAMLFDLSRAPRSPYTKANYDRLKLGMTMDEVVAILGEPGSVDQSLRDVAWVMWYNPFDSKGAITAIFAYPSEQLKSLEYTGELPDRALLLPDSGRKLRTPSFVKMLDKHQQEQERRKMLMLDPPKADPLMPALP